MSPIRTNPGHAHTHTVNVCSSALKASSARSALAGPRDWLGHPDTANHKSASHSLKHGLADALKYIIEWAAAVCTVIPHLSVQFVESLADAILLMLLSTTGNGSSCLYCSSSFICTDCTVFRSFLSALCVASEGPYK